MPKLEPAKVVMSGKLVAKIFLIAVGGGSMKSRSINVDINLGETIPVGNALQHQRRTLSSLVITLSLREQRRVDRWRL